MNRLNRSKEAELRKQLKRCCGSERFVDAVLEKRPFRSSAHLQKAAEDVWWSLDAKDWLEAFAAHPRIGDKEALRKKYKHRGWESGEQSGAADASEDTLPRITGETPR